MIPDWLSKIVVELVGGAQAACVWDRVSLSGLAYEIAIDLTRDKGRGGRTVKYLRPILGECGISKGFQHEIAAEIFDWFGNDAAAASERKQKAEPPKDAAPPVAAGVTAGTVVLIALGVVAVIVIVK